MTVGQLYDILQAHIDAQRYPVSQREVARALGVSPTTLGNWRSPTKLIGRDHLEAIARLTGVPYLRVLDALLSDIGYLEPRRETAGDVGEGPTSGAVAG